MPAARKLSRIERTSGGKFAESAFARFIQGLDMAGIEGDAGETQAGELLDGLGELQQGLSGGDADAAEAGIDFGEHADFDLAGAGGIGKLPRGEDAIEGDGDVGAASDFGQASEFVVADDGVGDQHVGGCGAHHDFRFGDFGDGETDGARGKLAPGDAHGFVRLRVGPEAELVLLGVGGHAGQVALEDVEIDDKSGRVNFRNVHVSYGISKVRRE